MAAPRIRCANCGDPFDRRQVTTAYCPEADCKKAHDRDRKREWRQAKAHLEHVRHRAAIERANRETGITA